MPGGWAFDGDDAPDPNLIAANARYQARVVLRLIRCVCSTPRELVLTPPLLLGLHRIAMDGVIPTAGQYRPDGEVYIGTHVPPPFTEIPGLVEAMCEEVQARWQEHDPATLAAFVLWRVCWIHPFVDGNGRTARALAYLVLSTRFGFPLPGKHPVPERIQRDRKRYYAALSAADEAWARGRVDVSSLASVLRRALRAQLTEKWLEE